MYLALLPHIHTVLSLISKWCAQQAAKRTYKEFKDDIDEFLKAYTKCVNPTTGGVYGKADEQVRTVLKYVNSEDELHELLWGLEVIGSFRERMVIIDWWA